MKALTLIIIAVATFVGLFFLTSMIGMLWASYSEVVTSLNWAIIYSLVIGWWTTTMVVIEFHEDLYNPAPQVRKGTTLITTPRVWTEDKVMTEYRQIYNS